MSKKRNRLAVSHFSTVRSQNVHIFIHLIFIKEFYDIFTTINSGISTTICPIQWRNTLMKKLTA
ncbi:MAG: hypothetical protein LUH42_03590, partial [Oscillospiraceae bacterium]|nr:hypothetical protein [Oscillospiraceae bacterium]